MLSLFRREKRAAFIPFIVAGDPSLETSERMVDALIEEGADLLCRFRTPWRTVP
jgi:tryptophan synthase alpha chain